MAATYEVTQEDGYLRIEGYPSITLEDYIQSYRDVAALDRETPQPRLWVLPEGIQGFGLAELRELAKEGTSLEVAGKAALVAPSEYVFGLARQVTMLRADDSDRFRVFRTEGEALEWLGFPPRSAAD